MSGNAFGTETERSTQPVTAQYSTDQTGLPRAPIEAYVQPAVHIEQDMDAAAVTGGAETQAAKLQIASSGSDLTTIDALTVQEPAIGRWVYAVAGGVLALIFTVWAGVNSRKRWPATVSLRIRPRIDQKI